MSVSRFGALTLGFAVVLASIALIGCGDTTEKPDKVKPDAGATTTDNKPPTGKEKTALKPGKGTFKGMVKLSGDKPDIAKLSADLMEQMKKKTDMKGPCLDTAPEEQKEQQDWKIGSNDGVADVFVYFRPVKDTFFAFDESDDAIKSAKDHNPKLTQPHCAFIPHALSVFPFYRDSKDKKKETGQKLIVTNMATVGHNTKIEGAGNDTIPAGGEKEPEIPAPKYTPYPIQCGVHPWMNAYLLVLENPYVAVTDKDGKFEIKNVPVGKVQVLVWHSNADNPKPLDFDLKAGENVHDFEVKVQK